MTKSDLLNGPDEAAVDLIDDARAQLAIFDAAIFTSADVLKDPAGARRAVQDAVTLLQRAAALLME
ncbi:hypothetical protein [uncultured Sphingomonas sp.]|uniref:hypothetical protein n=1 Tax=uncultured Sphingomonas sp. TaxID=158754 RepID=UPI002630C7F9|nr:hypothetical protein [uncultured Sphingomonas sp.]